jgi:hypothetical protein
MSAPAIDLDPLAIPVSGPARARRSDRRVAPVRYVRFGEAAIPVPHDEHRAAAVSLRAALWMVQHWGLVSIEAAADRARALAPGAKVNASLVCRLLSALPTTRWLDGPDRRWFSLTAQSSLLATTVRKVLSTARRVRIEDLREGLIKAVPAIGEAPSSVLEQYLRQIIGCTIDGATVHPPAGPSADAPILSAAEASLVEILEAAGGAIEPLELRRRALAAPLPEATSRRVLKMSPLFLPTADGLIRLIGRKRDARPARTAADRFGSQSIHP